MAESQFPTLHPHTLMPFPNPGCHFRFFDFFFCCSRLKAAYQAYSRRLCFMTDRRAMLSAHMLHAAGTRLVPSYCA